MSEVSPDMRLACCESQRSGTRVLSADCFFIAFRYHPNSITRSTCRTNNVASSSSLLLAVPRYCAGPFLALMWRFKKRCWNQTPFSITWRCYIQSFALDLIIFFFFFLFFSHEIDAQTFPHINLSNHSCHLCQPVLRSSSMATSCLCYQILVTSFQLFNHIRVSMMWSIRFSFSAMVNSAIYLQIAASSWCDSSSTYFSLQLSTTSSTLTSRSTKASVSIRLEHYRVLQIW